MLLTFLVGNGFDISVGMRTSYRDFYTWYCNQPSENSYVANLKTDILFNLDNWSDFELGLGKYTSHFCEGEINNFYLIYEDARNKIIEYLKLEMKKFKHFYVSEEKIKVDMQNFLNQLPSRIIKILDFLIINNNKTDSEVQFVSFNYTTLLDRFVESLSRHNLREISYKQENATCFYRLKVNPKVIHIHGTLDNNPILGVGHRSQISNQQLLSTQYFETLMVKSKTINALDESWYIDVYEKIDKSDVIFIFGMSLGDSDKLWWNTLYSWLRLRNDRHLIIYWYDSKLKNSNSILEILKRKNNIKDKFFSFSTNKLSESVDIYERVHIIFNTSCIFNVNLNSEKKELSPV